MDFVAAVTDYSDERGETVTHHLGNELDDQSVCPNVVFLCASSVTLDIIESVPVRPIFVMQAELYVAMMKVRDVHAFIHWLERTGIHGVIRALGWHLLVQLNIDPDEVDKEVILAPRIGRLAVTPQAIAQIVATRIFINQLRLQDDAFRSEKTVKVTIKLWDSWIWERNICMMRLSW